MHRTWIAREWVERPRAAGPHWPASELEAHPLYAPLALRVTNAENVIGHLTLVTPERLQIDGVHAVPCAVVRAYAVLQRLLDHPE